MQSNIAQGRLIQIDPSNIVLGRKYITTTHGHNNTIEYKEFVVAKVLPELEVVLYYDTDQFGRPEQETIKDFDETLNQTSIYNIFTVIKPTRQDQLDLL